MFTTMTVLANLYFDILAIYQGIAFLLFCVPVVLLSEYAVYRLFLTQQSRAKAVLTTFYANVVSTFIGIFIVESIDDVISGMEMIVESNVDLFHNVILFIVMFILTWFIEWLAVYPLRKKLQVQKAFVVVGIANAASYAALAVMIVLYNIATGS
jgi:hypothetical protein